MNKEAPTTFGALLRHLRLAAGLTQEELAERAQLSERAVRRLERDPDRMPRLQTVRLLAQALGLREEEQTRLLAAARSGHGAGGAIVPVPAMPRPLTSLIDREEEVAIVTMLLADRRLVTICGTGGVGKTRLALAVAERVASAFDRVVFVDLAPLNDPKEVLSAIAGSLAMREEGARSLVDLIVDELRSQRVLLVLDNMEHLVPAGATVLQLIGACPALSILITSREALRVRGERVYTLAPLPLPDRDGDIMRSPAVQLFLERARDAGSEIGMDPTLGEAIAELCRRLDGLPLAIELAAAWTPLLPPPALLARLTARLPYLERGPRDVPLRQRTMRETIAWSYALLTPEDQLLLARLSVFAGGCTLEAVRALGNGQAELDLLERMRSLVERSLIRQDAAHAPRFYMLETIQEYAAQKLTEWGEEYAIRSAHAAYFLELAEEAERQYYGTRSAASLDLLEAEHDNLRAALQWTLGEGDAQQGVRLAGALYRFWEVHGHLTEGRRWLASILDREDELGAPAKVLPARESGKAFPAISGATSPWGRVLAGAAVMAGWQGDYGEATLRCDQRLELSRELGDLAGIASALNDLGEIAAHQGDVARAAEYFEECIELDRALGDTASTAVTLGNLGWALRRLGDHERARALLEEARTLFREVGDTPHVPPVLCELAAALVEQRDIKQAMSIYRECGILLRDMGDKTLLPVWFEGLAALDASQGHVEREARLWGAAASLREAIASPPSPAERRALEEMRGRARARSGDDAWHLAWEAGRVMSLEEAMADALARRREETTT